MQHDAVSELFGLAGTFPRPGWVVLDAARDHRFTGELVFDTSPAVRVYFDRGQIYLAERVTDPSLGARLVDAGALSAVQLERGSVRVGEIEHLGRLFERIPALDRHTVIVTAELMTEECIGWVAAQRVSDVASTPYRHHESGMHLWSRASSWVDLLPGEPLPAPTPDDGPVSSVPPADFVPVVEHTETFLDGLIEWDEPSWLDGAELESRLVDPLAERRDQGGTERRDQGGTERPAERPDLASDVASDSVAADAEPGDWVDRLVLDGLPDEDPLSSPKALPRLPVAPVDRFELVWPTGEVDDDFGAVDSVVDDGHDPDADRIGATARLARPESDAEPLARPTSPSVADAPGTTEPDATSDATDEVVLAVRRAVASIDVGSLAARQRLVETTGDLGSGSRGVDVVDESGGVPAPGRVAVRSGRNDWSRRTVTRSVFDEPAFSEPEPTPAPEPADAPADHRERRAGALRRLIASLRR